MKNIFTCLLLVLCSGLFGQKQWNNWYFADYTALNFNSGAPVFVSGSNMIAFEGAASISDASGNLLFYTNGDSVWDRNNMVTPNGRGLTATYSTAQPAVILPNPANANQYYIFTADEYFHGGVNGYRYSIFDMTLNGGFGDITATKNVLLYAPACEKITATKNAGGTGFWIITHRFASDTFVTYQLTAAGVSAPVYSATGTSYAGNFGPIACFSMSFDGSRLSTGLEGLGELELYDFDNATGIVSNAINLGVVQNSTTSIYSSVFSPDGTKLYNTSEGGANLIQWNLAAGSTSAIISSQMVVNPSNASGLPLQMLQNAPDGKIYMCQQEGYYLPAIRNPNALGLACQYTDSGAYLGGNLCRYGLPSVVASFLYTGIGYSYQSTCVGDSTRFDLLSAADSVRWDFGDPASGTADTSTLTAPAHIFTSAATYTVTLIAWHTGLSDTTVKQVTINALPVVNLGPDTAICQGHALLLEAGNPGATYLWQDSSIMSSYTVTGAGEYSVTVSAGGCTASDSIYVGLAAPSLIQISHSICTGSSYIFGSHTLTSAGIYSDTVSAIQGCDSIVQLHLSLWPLPVVSWFQKGVIVGCSGILPLSGGIPAGGYYSGSYVHGDSIAGAPEDTTFTVYYNYTDSNGCTNSASLQFTTTICTGIDNISSNDNISLYPNPNKGSFTLTTGNLQQPTNSYTITDMIGNIIEEKAITSSTQQIDMSDAAEGVYTLTVKGANPLRFVVVR